jgi:hypothetical protein
MRCIQHLWNLCCALYASRETWNYDGTAHDIGFFFFFEGEEAGGLLKFMHYGGRVHGSLLSPKAVQSIYTKVSKKQGLR